MKNKKFYPWLVVALLWVVALLNYMDRQMLSTMQAEMKVDIVELQQAEAFGALMAVFLWVYGIVSPFAGIVADRISRKKLVVGSLFVWSLVTYLMGDASSFNQLYMLRALMGISEALYIPSALSLIADWHEGKSRSLAIGVHMTGLYVGQAIGGFGATVAAAFSWHTTFHWFGILGIAYSVVLLLLLHDKDKDAVNAAPVQQAKPAKGGLFQGLSVVLSTWAFWLSSSILQFLLSLVGQRRTGFQPCLLRIWASQCRRRVLCQPSPSPYLHCMVYFSEVCFLTSGYRRTSVAVSIPVPSVWV